MRCCLGATDLPTCGAVFAIQGEVDQWRSDTCIRWGDNLLSVFACRGRLEKDYRDRR